MPQLNSTSRGPPSIRHKTVPRAIFTRYRRCQCFQPGYSTQGQFQRCPRIYQLQEREVDDDDDVQGDAHAATRHVAWEEDGGGNDEYGHPRGHEIQNQIEPSLEAERQVHRLLRFVERCNEATSDLALPAKSTDRAESINLWGSISS